METVSKTQKNELDHEAFRRVFYRRENDCSLETNKTRNSAVVENSFDASYDLQSPRTRRATKVAL